MTPQGAESQRTVSCRSTNASPAVVVDGGEATQNEYSLASACKSNTGEETQAGSGEGIQQ